MERFVQFVVGGGIIMLAGLWITGFTEAWTPGWLTGAAIALLGFSVILWGIWSQVETEVSLERWV